jgi:hypothetical protein
MAFNSIPTTASSRDSKGNRSRVATLTLPQHLREREWHADNAAAWRRNLSLVAFAIEVVVVEFLIVRRWGML